MKVKFIILFLILSANSVFAQFFDTEEDFEQINNEQIVDTEIFTIKNVPAKVSISLVDSITAYSKMFLGTRYCYGGSKETGFDCSGFVSFIYNKFGINLPRTASAQYLANYHIDRENLQKGDLVFFEGRKKNKNIGHVGMVVSDSLENGLFKFIHASVTRGVTVSLSSETYYEDRYLSACRIFDVDTLTIPFKRTEIKFNEKAKITENQYHTVKKDETLYSIAKKYGKTVAQLRTLNKNSSNNLKIGQKLLINKAVQNVEIPQKPSEEQIQISDNQQQPTEYIVKSGDTLYKISKQFNTTIEKIKEDNNLMDNSLSINQKLIIKL